MTWKLKLRSNPGSPIAAEYECPEHGMFTATVGRDDSGDPPAEVACSCEIVEDAPCPVKHVIRVAVFYCGLTSPWRPSAIRGRVKLGEVDRGPRDGVPAGRARARHPAARRRDAVQGMEGEAGGDHARRQPQAASRGPRRPREGANRMSDDGIDVRIRGWCTPCAECVRLCWDGMLSKPGGLLRAAVVHAMPLGGEDVALCEEIIGPREREDRFVCPVHGEFIATIDPRDPDYAKCMAPMQGLLYCGKWCDAVGNEAP